MTVCSWFVWTLPTTPMLMRRRSSDAGLIDEIFRDGQWQPTKRIVDHMAGEDDNVEQISEARARRLLSLAV